MSPDTVDSRPYEDGHGAYLAAGWQGVLPVGLDRGVPWRARKARPPDGYTGGDGGWPDTTQIRTWAAQWPQLNLGLRLPPDIVGVDVDHYVSARTGEIKRGGEVLARMVLDWGPLPRTWRSTSRGLDNPSGVYLFRIPVGLRLIGSTPGGVEFIQAHHRYALCWPSIHPEGRLYRWVDPSGEVGGIPRYDDEAIPDLPWPWQDGLTAPAAPDGAQYPEAAPQRAAQEDWAPAVLRAWAEAVERLRAAQVGGRHDTAVAVACGFARQEQLGLAGATSALERFGPLFVSSVAADRGGPAPAEREWQAAVASGRAKVQGTESTVAAERESVDEFWERHRARRETPPSEPEPEPDETDEADGASWVPADVDAALNGELLRPKPLLLNRGDTGAFYAGQVNYLHGPDGIGKSFVALFTCMEVMASGLHVLWLDFEDTLETVLARLLDFGTPPPTIRRCFHYVRPDEPSSRAVIDGLVALVQAHGVVLAVIDSVGEAFAVDGIDENHDNEVAPWFRLIAKRLADAGAAVIPVDHGTKSQEATFFPSGSKRKRAMVSGCAVYVEPVRMLTRDDGGLLRLVCAKDRHGTYRRGEVIGELEVYVRPVMGSRVLGWRLRPPPTEPESPAITGLEVAVRAVVRAARKLRDSGLDEQPSLRSLTAAVDLVAAAGTKRAAVDLAVKQGLLKEISGTNRSRRFVLVEPDEDEKD